MYLVEVSVVLLNLGLVLHPDLHPEALLLAVSSTHGVSVVPGVSLPVLELPGLGVAHEENIYEKQTKYYLPLLYDGLKGGDSANSLEPDKSEQESHLHLVVSVVCGEIFVLKESQYNYVI